ncbi:hypothetical protein BH09MYX1_BH09MYX1_18920 [soil metagenome]
MSAITCSRCGGPLPPSAAHVATTCSFCGATSAKAPEVIETVVERVVVVAPKDASAFRCPRCADRLRDASVKGTVIRGCDQCGGIWLDSATVEHLKNVRDDELGLAARRLVGVILRRADRSPMVSCPVCGVAMTRTEVGGTIHCVDTCKLHGTWFDGLELPEFISAFAEARAGDVSEDDAEAAGVPRGFFTKLFGG